MNDPLAVPSTQQAEQADCNTPYVQNEQYCLEMFRRAMVQRDPLAREVLQQRFSETVLHWMRSHPNRETACCFDSEEKYVAQAFARFWQTTATTHESEFSTLATALRCLYICLNGVIVDTLRAHSRPKEVSLPGPDASGEPFNRNESRDLWETIRSLLPDKKEQRVAYLLFHCGLKPGEIVHFCLQEFSEVQEIYRLRRNIVERLLSNVDQLR